MGFNFVHVSLDAIKTGEFLLERLADEEINTTALTCKSKIDTRVNVFFWKNQVTDTRACSWPHSVPFKNGLCAIDLTRSKKYTGTPLFREGKR